MITRWSKTGKTMASLGQSFTGWPTPSQLDGAQSASSASSNSHVQSRWDQSGDFKFIVQSVRSDRSAGVVVVSERKPDTIDQLDSAIKALLRTGRRRARAAR